MTYKNSALKFLRRYLIDSIVKKFTAYALMIKHKTEFTYDEEDIACKVVLAYIMIQLEKFIQMLVSAN